VKWKFRVPRMPRASKRVLWGAGGVMMVIVLWMAAPLALRRVAFFRVRQVELVGIRYLDADRVLAALRMSPRASVFDRTEVLVERLRALEGVADAAVIRQPPASLKVIVREVEPVALVANQRGALGAVDADGHALPYELGTLDLPVVPAPDSGVVAVLARVQAYDPSLHQAIDAARRMDARRGGEGGDGDVQLELGTHRVLLGPNAGPEVIQAVMLVARDLAAKARPYTELDGRYAGQVIVRRRPRNRSA
jgi:cell division septal protein FtsQ